MSGICGVWAFDGAVPDLGRVLAQLERRGPDGTHNWSDGRVALGHTLLATTPEALVEQLPLADPASGCTITADVRLDNRAELIAALDLAGETRTIGDGELILRAYLKWGEDCPTHLLGDFAFAIWNPRATRLFCARDQMGMRQFNYCHVPGRLFAFATVDTALLALPAVPGTINEPRIADYLTDLESVDFTSTFFEQIHRLAPAHSLTVTPSGIQTRRYWTLTPGPLLDLPSDAAYAAAFLDVFTDAVRCRLRTASGLGAMLSGGLDSSSVVAVAASIRKEPLRTISAVDPEASNCPETRAIQSMLTIRGLDPILVGKADFGGKRDALVVEMDDVRNPFEVHMTMLRSIYMVARDHGLNVVLDGGAGDVILTSDNRIAALLRQRRFRKASAEAKAAQSFWGTAKPGAYPLRDLLAGAWVAFAPIWLRSAWRRMRMSVSLADARPDFARRVDFPSRRQAADRHVSMHIRGDAARRAQAIVHPNLSSGRERYDQVAGSFGVESRDPFMDLRVIQFCLSLPPEQLQDDGWPKIILRRAIAGMVPGEIAWRRGKEHLGGDFSLRLLESWPEWADSMRDPRSPLTHYLARPALDAIRVQQTGAPTGETLPFFALDRFLRRHVVKRTF